MTSAAYSYFYNDMRQFFRHRIWQVRSAEHIYRAVSVGALSVRTAVSSRMHCLFAVAVKAEGPPVVSSVAEFHGPFTGGHEMSRLHGFLPGMRSVCAVCVCTALLSGVGLQRLSAQTGCITLCWIDNCYYDVSRDAVFSWMPAPYGDTFPCMPLLVPAGGVNNEVCGGPFTSCYLYTSLGDTACPDYTANSLATGCDYGTLAGFGRQLTSTCY